jgi:hypothetical protein
MCQTALICLGQASAGQPEIATPIQMLQEAEGRPLRKDPKKSTLAKIHGCSPTEKVISFEKHPLAIEICDAESRTKSPSSSKRRRGFETRDFYNVLTM